MITKLCKEIVQGDKVERHDGKILTIESVALGMLVGHKMMNFTNGEWAHAKPNDEIELAA